MKEVFERWNEYCAYIVETMPNYTDNDFNFNDFMDWYGSLPKDNNCG